MQVKNFRTAFVDLTDMVLVKGVYRADGSTMLRLVKPGDSSQTLTLTVCLADSGVIPEPGNVFIKDWGENEGVLAALQRLGVVGHSLHRVPAGFVEADEVKLLLDAASIPDIETVI